MFDVVFGQFGGGWSEGSVEPEIERKSVGERGRDGEEKGGDNKISNKLSVHRDLNRLINNYKC